MCASGCYYIAAAAGKICQPLQHRRQIGVIGGFDVTGLMDKLGIKRRLKTAGSNKGMGDPFLTPGAGENLGSMLSDTHQNSSRPSNSDSEKIERQRIPRRIQRPVYTALKPKKSDLLTTSSVYIARDVVRTRTGQPSPEDDFQKTSEPPLWRASQGEVENTVEMW